MSMYANVVTIIVEEHMKARQKFPPMNSSHEGYAVILEELDEMWEYIKSNNIEAAKGECIQVAAMCIAFLLEVDSPSYKIEVDK